MPRSIYYDTFGSLDVLQEGEIEPMPMGPDCVTVDVAGAGINPVDFKIREGYLAGGIETFFPVVPGWDVSGTVSAVGPAVGDLQVGDAVFGYCRMDVIKHGTLSDQVNLPARLLAAAPSGIDLADAGAVPLTGLTAYQLLQRLDIQPGETVLVHNAAGGVGQFAAQLARLSGARVIGTASRINHEHLRSLGVDPVLYGPALPEAVRAMAPEGIDVVVDLIGGRALSQSDGLLRRGARLGSIADAAGVKERGGVYVFVHPSPVDLAQLARLIDRGELAVDIAERFPLSEVKAAYRRLESGHVRGKIVVIP